MYSRSRSHQRRSTHSLVALLHGYREEEDALQTVRGRIRLDDQMRRRPGFLLPVEVRYDEFTDDILENRLVKAAVVRLKPNASPLLKGAKTVELGC